MTKSSHINSSGFPLQIGLANAIDSTQIQHGWSVLYKEHGWKHHKTGESGFIDLVLENIHKTVVLNVECKRQREATWQFLLPKPSDKFLPRCKFWATYGGNGVLSYFDWVDLSIKPISYESEFCVISGEDYKTRPMLERMASTVIESTEAFAHEESILIVKEKMDKLRTYINIIVTTAKLEVCKFDPANIDLKAGMLGEDAVYEYVPYIRFRKQLLSSQKPLTALNWKDGPQAISRAKENTVLIVGATEVISLLGAIEISNRIGSIVTKRNICQ